VRVYDRSPIIYSFTIHAAVIWVIRSGFRRFLPIFTDYIPMHFYRWPFELNASHFAAAYIVHLVVIVYLRGLQTELLLLPCTAVLIFNRNVLLRFRTQLLPILNQPPFVLRRWLTEILSSSPSSFPCPLFSLSLSCSSRCSTRVVGEAARSSVSTVSGVIISFSRSRGPVVTRSRRARESQTRSRIFRVVLGQWRGLATKITWRTHGSSSYFDCRCIVIWSV